MNNLIYGAIGFLLGSVLGGALVGNMITKDCQKKLEEADRRNRLLVDELVALRDKKYEEHEKELDEKFEEKKKEFEDKYEVLRKVYASTGEIEEDEEDVFSPAHYDIPKIGEDDVPLVSDIGYDSKIRVINKQMFDEESNYRDVAKMTYYQPNEFLIDETDDIIKDEETIIGEEAMDIINETKNDYMYVLDPKKDVVYEIEINHTDEYTRDVIGL